MSISIWSFDDGYGDNKLYNGSKVEIIPSHCTTWKPRMKSELSSKELDPLSHLGVEVEGMRDRFLVGQGALEQSSSLTWAGGNNKHKDFYFPVVAKACLGVMSGKLAKVDVDVLVMGLPVKAEESDERHELLQETMIGEHKVLMSYADGKRSKK